MASEHETRSVAEAKIQPDTKVETGDLPPSEKDPDTLSLSSSSSMSSSSSSGVFQVDADDFTMFTETSTASSNHGDDEPVAKDGEDSSTDQAKHDKNELVSIDGGEKFSEILAPKTEQPNEKLVPAIPPPLVSSCTPEPGAKNVIATQSPPVQIMERPAETAPAPYRIPSSVFARSNNNQVDWSVASNESLFSIHMGNMSFTKDQLALFGRSGELGNFGDMSMFSGTSFPPPPSKINDPVLKPPNLIEDPLVTDAAAETMKEVLQANANQQQVEEKKNLIQRISSPGNVSLHSEDSNCSHKSFAFPILGGDGAKSVSVKPLQSRPHSPSQIQTQAQEHQGSETKKVEHPPKTQGWLAVPNFKKWPCFSCCF